MKKSMNKILRIELALLSQLQIESQNRFPRGNKILEVQNQLISNENGA
jgi:hypothetical protein